MFNMRTFRAVWDNRPQLIARYIVTTNRPASVVIQQHDSISPFWQLVKAKYFALKLDVPHGIPHYLITLIIPLKSQKEAE